jgi:DNA-binding transcriptional LysR family regulator
MDTMHMREFLTLVKQGSFTKAAETLYISQPTLTRHMNALEHELGCLLIERDSRSFELTAYGKLVVDAFRRILSEYQNLVYDIEQASDHAGSDLIIGMLYYGVSAYYGYPLLQEFSLRNPHVHISTLASQSGQVYRNVKRGVIDVALTITDETVNDELERWPIARIPLYAFMQTDHPLASRDCLSLEELAEQPIVVNRYSKDMATNVEKLFSAHGIQLTHIVACNHIDELLMTIAASEGIFIGSMLLTAIPQQHHVFIPIEAEDFQIEIALVWRGGNPNPAISKLVEASRHIRLPQM